MQDSNFMRWQPIETDPEGANVLHLKMGYGDWAPFWEYPFAVELEIAKGTISTRLNLELAQVTNLAIEPIQESLGWFAYQALLAEGWELLPFDRPEDDQAIVLVESEWNFSDQELKLLAAAQQYTAETISKHEQEANIKGWLMLGFLLIAEWVLLCVGKYFI